MSSTCFEHPNVRPQKDLNMQFYGISGIHISSLVDVRTCLYQAHPAIDQTAYTDACKKYHKTTCSRLPEDEHLDVRNMSKTIKLN